MIYTSEEIARRVAPVARKHGIRRVFLFGSYARGEADHDSDVDLLIDDPNAHGGLFEWSDMYADFEEALGKEIDMVELESMGQPPTFQSTVAFWKEVLKEAVNVYGDD